MVFPARRPSDRQIGAYGAWPPPAEPGRKLTYMWAEYYSRVSQAFEAAVTERCASGFTSAASDLLVKASQESSLFLLWDHMNSSDWLKKPSHPSSNELDDPAAGLLDYLSSLQWEPMMLCSLTPGSRLIVEVGDPSEDPPARPLCEMTAGAVAAVMDLLYGEGKDPEDKLFSFRAVETACRRNASPVCRFEVERNPHYGLEECLKIDPQKH